PEHDGHAREPRVDAQGRFFALGRDELGGLGDRVPSLRRRARRLRRGRPRLRTRLMKIAAVGGGPAALYFAILRKKARPEDDIVLYERNAPLQTFGWGVVFSDETLGNFQAADAVTHDAIQSAFVHWTDIDVFVKGERIRSTGHGFAGMGRRALLGVLQNRARDL